jgi:hypothetical protein
MALQYFTDFKPSILNKKETKNVRIFNFFKMLCSSYSGVTIAAVCKALTEMGTEGNTG